MKSYKTDYDNGKNIPKNRYQMPVAPTGRMKFRLESQQEELNHQSNANSKQFSFYQICQFPVDKQYTVRKLIYDSEGEIVTYRESKLKKDVLDKFLKKSQRHKYTIYPTYALDVVGFPDPTEILTALSQILNGYEDYHQ